MDMIFKFFKFGIVGFSGVIIDYFFTYVCKEKFKIHKYVSNSIGFIVAASSNYILNRIWTFQSLYPKILIEFSSFILISIIGLLINNFFLYLFYNKFKFVKTISSKLNFANTYDTPFYISKMFAIAITTIWNFFANYYITFNL